MCRGALLKAEEDWIASACSQIAALKPDLVITEKGLSDLAAHFLTKAGISAIRRLRKTDNNRIARATGATICHRIEEVRAIDDLPAYSLPCCSDTIAAGLAILCTIGISCT